MATATGGLQGPAAAAAPAPRPEAGAASGLGATLRRFPSPVALAAGATVAIFFLNGADGIVEPFWLPALATATGGFLAAVTLAVLAERGVVGRPLAELATLAALAFLAWQFFGRGLDGGPGTGFLIAAGLLLLPFAVGPRGGAFWAFAAAAAFALAAAIVGGAATALLVITVVSAAGTFLPFASGLGALAWALSLALGAGLVPALVGLRLLPEPRDDAACEAVPLYGALRLFAEAVLVPAAWLLAAVLHAYLVRIILAGRWPEGVVWPYVVGFSLLLTAAWYLAWPWRATGAAHVRLFYRAGLALLPLPLGMLALALRERVLAYGWTEDRLLVAFLAAWLLAWALAYVARSARLPLRGPVLSLAALLLLSSVGPFTLVDAAIRLQAARLRALHADPTSVGDPRRDDVDVKLSAAALYLAERDALGIVADLAPGWDAPSHFGGSDFRARSFVAALGRRYWDGRRYTRQDPVANLELSSDDSTKPWNVSGFDIVLPSVKLEAGTVKVVMLDGGATIALRLSADVSELLVRLPGDETVSLRLPLPQASDARGPIEIEASAPSGQYRIRVRVTDMLVTMRENGLRDGGVNFRFALALPRADAGTPTTTPAATPPPPAE